VPVVRRYSQNTHVIDTSALVTIGQRGDISTVLPLIHEQIGKYCLVTTEHVKKELKRKFPEIEAMYRGEWPRFLFKDIYKEPIFGETGRITRMYRLTPEISEFDRADPWLVAVAKHLVFPLVNDETTRQHKTKKLPYVCSKEGVRSLTSAEYVRDVLGIS
jgi:hypothetical protein